MGIGELIESFMAESSQCLTRKKDSENCSVCALVVHCLEVSLCGGNIMIILL